MVRRVLSSPRHPAEPQPVATLRLLTRDRRVGRDPGSPSVRRSNSDGLTVGSISVRAMSASRDQPFGRCSASPAAGPDDRSAGNSRRGLPSRPRDGRAHAGSAIGCATSGPDSQSSRPRHRSGDQLLQNRACDGIESGFHHHIRDLGSLTNRRAATVPAPARPRAARSRVRSSWASSPRAAANDRAPAQ